MEGVSHSSPLGPLWGESERDQPLGPLTSHLPPPHVSTTSPQLQPTAGPSHWNPPRALILASPPLPLRWLRQPPSSGLRVISMPTGVTLCRGVVLHRPASPHITPPHPPPLPPPPRAPDPGRPWRGQVPPLLLRPLVVGPPQGSGGGVPSRPGNPPPARPPPTAGYSRGVYHNFRKWQQYKGLARAHLAQSPDTEALACFFIPVLRSLSQCQPQLGTEEGVPLAVQEWSRLSNFDRMIYYEMAEKFMEFEMEENAQWSPADPVPLPAGISPGVQLVSRTKAKPEKQVVEDPGGRKAGGKGGSQRSHKQPKTPARGTGGHHQSIPLEAVEQYIEIMEALGLPPPDTEAHLQEPPEEHCEEEVEILRYIEKLCSKDSFISKTETIIHPRFLSDLLSPHASLDFPQLLRDLASEAEDSETPTAEAVSGRPTVPPILRCPSPPLARQPEATQPLPELLLSPVGQDCPYSSHLQRLALQSAHSQCTSSSVNTQAPAQPPPPTVLPPESFQRVSFQNTPPLSPGVSQPGSHGPIVSRDCRTGPPGLTDAGRPASGQQDRQAKGLAKGEAPSLGQAQSRAPAGDKAQTRCPIESQGKNRASTAEAQIRAQANDQAQCRVLSKSQKQIKALAVAHAHSKAPTEPQAQIKDSSEARTQTRGSTETETQNRGPNEAQGKIGGLIGDEAQIKAPALAQSQIRAKVEAQTQIMGSAEAQTQIKSLTVAQAHSEAQAEGKAPTPCQGAGNVSHGHFLPQDPMSLRDGCGEGEVAVKLEDRACWRIPQDEARSLGLLSSGQVLSCARASEEAGIGRNSPVPRTWIHVEKKKHDAVAVRRSKRMKRD